MAYKVIARKYRPRTFADVVGQQHVTRTLANAIQSNRVAHAYIFSGVRGVGKTTTARILAKALNCAKGPTAEPDNSCDSCVAISEGSSLDVLEIDAASNRGIDQIRELREMVRYAPAASRYKIVILDEAHQLTDEASNALLKTLEEPPERVIFILATTRAEDLAETIKSRAQLFQFRALAFQEIAEQMGCIARAENLRIEPAAVAVLARAAEGSLRDALSLLEQAIAYCGDSIADAQVRELLGVVAERVLDELVEAIAGRSAERALGLVHRLIADGQNLQHFCREAIRHFRNLLIARVCGADSELVAAPPGERPRIAEQAARFSEEDLTRFFQLLLVTDDDLRRHLDPRLHLELGLLKMVNAQRLAPLEEVLAELRGSGAQAAAGAGATRAISGFATASEGSPGGHEPRAFAAAAQASAPATAPEPKMAHAAAQRAAASASAASAPLSPGPAAPASAKSAARSGPEIAVRSAEGATDAALLARAEAIRAALQNHKFLWSIAEQAARWELEGAELRIIFSPENRGLKEMLEARDPMERLRTVASEAAGQPLRAYVRLDSGQQGADYSDFRASFERDPVVRAVVEKFGGQISRVKRPGEE